MIETQALGKRYGDLVAVDGITFKVEPGQVLGFLGPNGAGKSTTMKMIAGFLAPTSGSARVCGFDVEEQSLEARRVVGYLPEGAPSYGEMDVRQFLEFIADAREVPANLRNKRIDDAIDRLNLENVLQQPIDTLSKGFKRRVGLAQAIIHDPKVLILDEPTDGLDPNQKHHVRQLIRNLAKDKIVIISTHILEEVSAVCSRAIIIARGRILADGTPKELEARSAYHGAVSIRLTEDFDLPAALAGDPDVREIEQVGDSGRHFILLPVAGRHLFNKVSEKSQNGHWPVAEFHMVEGLLEDYFRHVTQDSALANAGSISTEQQG